MYGLNHHPHVLMSLVILNRESSSNINEKNHTIQLPPLYHSLSVHVFIDITLYSCRILITSTMYLYIYCESLLSHDTFGTLPTTIFFLFTGCRSLRIQSGYLCKVIFQCWSYMLYYGNCWSQINLNLLNFKVFYVSSQRVIHNGINFTDYRCTPTADDIIYCIF